jgi:hypothetical protein
MATHDNISLRLSRLSMQKDVQGADGDRARTAGVMRLFLKWVRQAAVQSAKQGAKRSAFVPALVDGVGTQRPHEVSEPCGDAAAALVLEFLGATVRPAGRA